MTRKILLSLVVSATALTAGLSQAQTVTVQDYGRLITFGDSLSDSGNLFATTGNPPVPYNRRFTNELVFAEYLVGTMNGFTSPVTTGNTNYAFGGARTDLAPNSNGPIPSTGTQIGTYISRGGTFGSRDVVTLWGGANNLFQGLPVAAGNPATAPNVMTAIANASAADITAQTNQIAGAGAGTIVVFNLPDLANSPQFKGGPAEALAGFSGGAFNSALNSGLQSIAASRPNTNIVQVDVSTAFKLILANPQAFGITNATQACISVTSCITGGASVQNTYLFFDGVHPTAAGHKLVAQMTTQYLYTPTLSQGAAMFADISYASRRSNMLALSHRLTGQDRGLYVELVGDQGKRDRTISLQPNIGAPVATLKAKAYDYDLTGLRLGVTHDLSDATTIAIGASYMTGDATGYMVSAKPKIAGFDAGLNWRKGNHFMLASLGAGFEAYEDYRRSTTLNAIKIEQESVKAYSASANLEGGFDHEMGRLTITPLARLSYIRAAQRSFAENYTIGAVEFDGRNVSAFSGALEARASLSLSETTSLSGHLGYEANLSGESDALKGKLINNTAQAFQTAQPDVPSEGVLAGIGFETKLAGFTFAARYSGTFGEDDQTKQSGQISLSKKF
jgi:outer membrane lipase/esterase